MSKQERIEYNAAVRWRQEINPQLIVLRVQADFELFDFQPGQFAVLGLYGREPRVPEADKEDPAVDPDKLIRRAYSISSSSLEKRHVEFYLNLVTSGELTPRLFALKQDDPLFLSPKPSGVFTLNRVPAGKAVIMIATGTGLAPYVSMARTMLMKETDRKFIILHGARYSWDLGYRAELEALARICPNLVYIPSITRPEEDRHYRGYTGRIQTLLRDGLIERLSGVPLDPSKADVLLCGNPEMIEQVKDMLQSKGFVADQGKQLGTIHVEEYW